MTTIAEFTARVTGYSEEQMMALAGALDKKLGKNSNETIPEDEFNAALATFSPQAAARRDILFVGFKGTQQALVDTIATAFGDVITMVDSGLAGAGLSNATTPTPYEILFGKKTSRSTASYPLRQRKVTDMLTAIRTGVTDRWIVEYKERDGDIASWSGGTKINIGTGWRGTGKYTTGFLIHEMGHRCGLVDVCSTCLRTQLTRSHYQPTYTYSALNCKRNDLHGGTPMVTANTGHFIGTRRCRMLALEQKNLTIWNADSYRWFCSYFHKTEVQAGTTATITW